MKQATDAQATALALEVIDALYPVAAGLAHICRCLEQPATDMAACAVTTEDSGHRFRMTVTLQVELLPPDLHVM